MSEQTHGSVAKGLHVIGVPRDHVRVVPCDDAFRMDAAALERAVAVDEAAGLRPFVAVATAGTTNTGSVDPLREVARVCGAQGLWMHVDGAFGASVLLTRHRGMLDGVELADSLSWDAHKWLFQTYSCGMVLVRDRGNLVSTYAAHPEYLRDLEEGGATNPWDLGPELTRPARGLKLWFTLQTMGSEGLAAAVEHGFDLARWAQDEAERTRDVEVSRRMCESGYAAVFTTELRGRRCLRICAIHPEATEDDMRGVVRGLRAICDEVLAS